MHIPKMTGSRFDGDVYLGAEDKRMNMLFSFVGNRDPFVEGGEEFGPVLSHLESAAYGRVYLIYTGPEYLERARSVEGP